MARILVGRIAPRREAFGPEVPQNVRAPERQQRPHQDATPCRHAREARRSRALESAHEHGLDLIVGVVSRDHQLGAELEAGGFEPGVSGGAGRGLAGIGAERAATVLATESVAVRQRSDRRRHLRACRVDAVVEMGHNEVESVELTGGDEQMQQHDRVGTARHGHQGPGGRQAQRDEVGAERLEQGHRLSSTSRTLRERSAGTNGFWRNGAPGRSSPRRTMSSSV